MTYNALQKKIFAQRASIIHCNRSVSPIGDILTYIAAATSFGIILSIALGLA